MLFNYRIQRIVCEITLYVNVQYFQPQRSGNMDNSSNFSDILSCKAYKFRLNTNAETDQLMSQFAGNCRFLWNKALATNLFKLENKQKICYYQEFDFFSKLWKKSDEYGFLKLSPAQTLQQNMKQL